MAVVVGPGSADQLGTLAKELERRTLADSNRKSANQYSEYHPWMSHGLVDLKGMNGPIASPLATDEDLIRYRAELKTTDSPLGRLDEKVRHFKISEPGSNHALEFRQLFERILKFNSSASPKFWAKIRQVVCQIVPIEAANPITNPTRRNGSGFSNHYLRGLVFLSLPSPSPEQSLEAALNLAHEAGHQALMILQCGDNILEGPLGTPVYSIIRKTNRPAILSFHATIATAFMVEWMMESRESLIELTSPRYLAHRWQGLMADLKSSVDVFTTCKFSPFGQIILRELRAMYITAQDLDPWS